MINKTINRFAVVITMALIAAGCSKTKDILFCEGVSPDGKGVNCGKKFISGELTAIIKSNEPFGVDSLSLRVFDISGKKEEKVETVSVDVNPDRETVNANLSFYTGGTYRIVALKKDTKIAEGTIEIIE